MLRHLCRRTLHATTAAVFRKRPSSSILSSSSSLRKCEKQISLQCSSYSSSTTNAISNEATQLWKDTQQQTALISRLEKIKDEFRLNNLVPWQSDFELNKNPNINKQEVIQLLRVCTLLTRVEINKLTSLQLNIIEHAADFIVNLHEYNNTIFWQLEREQEAARDESEESDDAEVNSYHNKVESQSIAISSNLQPILTQDQNHKILVVARALLNQVTPERLMSSNPLTLLKLSAVHLHLASLRKEGADLKSRLESYMTSLNHALSHNVAAEQIPMDILAIGFTVAPHVANWSAMESLGRLITKVTHHQQLAMAPTAPSIRSKFGQDDADTQIFQYFHHNAEKYPLQTFDYSIIYDLISNEKAVPATHPEDTTAPNTIYASYAVDNVKILLMSTLTVVQDPEGNEMFKSALDEPVAEDVVDNPERCYDDRIGYADVEVDEAGNHERLWIPITNILPNIIQWGNAVMWYQVNGQVSLAGVADTKLDKIHLRGFTEMEGVPREEATSSVGGADRQALMDHLSARGSGDGNTVLCDKRLRSEFILHKTNKTDEKGGMIYEGTHTRAVDLDQTDGQYVESTLTYKIVATLYKDEGDLFSMK